MVYFTKDFIDFFKELEKNNTKEWFNDHRKSYESFVRKPMLELVRDVVEEMKKYDAEINPDLKKSLGRINRDIRFSTDKTPYNTHFFAQVMKGTKLDPIPGIAFRFGGYDSGIMGGYYNPSKERLAKIKNKIKGCLTKFQELKNNKDFVERFGTIKGEAYKRIPAELLSTFEKEPLIANKQFYYVKEMPAEFVLSDTLKKDIISYWLAAKPMNDFFSS